MALAASPPPAQLSETDFDQMNDLLDDDISSIQAEIEALTQHRKLLSATLLSSTIIQNQLKAREQSTLEGLPEDITPLLESSQQHAETNVHRLAYGVTAFPFADPNPETSTKRLLGIRLDICNRDGKFGKPHYLLCKRVDDSSNDMRIHRHTIPGFIPLKDYEEQYLPLQDEGYLSGPSTDGSTAVKQDLHGLVQKTRCDLVSWTRRREAIDLLREELGLASDSEDGVEMSEENQGTARRRSINLELSYGVEDVSAVSKEAKYAKIVWSDGRAGRVKISDDGMIERAVVVGNDGRVRNAERLLSEGGVSIQELTNKLKLLYEETMDIDED